jgi:hypothetical protein
LRSETVGMLVVTTTWTMSTTCWNKGHFDYE